MHRYPQDTKLTIESATAALQSQNGLLDNAVDCYALWQGLSGAARTGAEADTPDWPAVKTLWLIADACSMMLDGESTNTPFTPLAILEQGRSAVPQDFGPDDIALFSEISKSVQNRALRARLADLAWIAAKPKNVENARRAIDAYVQVAPDETNWGTALKEWRRALSLCMQLREGSQGRLQTISSTLERIAEASIPLGSGFGLAMARLVYDRKLTGANGGKFAELLAAQGESMMVPGGDAWNARSYMELAAQWFERLKNLERHADVTVKIALSFETDADLRIARDPRTGNLSAQSLLNDAIQTLRKVPGDQRTSRGVEAHLVRLSQRLTKVGEAAIKQMATVTTGTTDITEIAKSAIRAVKGKKPLEALLELVHLHPGANLAEMTMFAQESLREFSLSSLFSASYISSDGRVIAKTPGGELDDTADGPGGIVFGKIMQHYWIDINLVCQGQIAPALSTIIREHTIGRGDLAQLLSSAPIVPPGRAEQFAKGLWAGFEGDFTSSMYLLAPQLEHLVRWHLKQAGATTTNLAREGIENETGLSSLVDSPELGDLLGENIVFEMRALFCTALGPNLRNEVAHGLLSAEEGHSIATIYAWWWVLRLTLRSFLHARPPSEQALAVTETLAQHERDAEQH